MLILIVKDEATTVPREVADMNAARAAAAEGMPVLAVDGGEHVPLDEYAAAHPELELEPASEEPPIPEDEGAATAEIEAPKADASEQPTA